MKPSTVTALAFLLAEFLAAGVSFSQILADVKGRVSAEIWAEIIAEIDKNEAPWR